MQVADVFVAGGLPRATYVNREARGLEKSLRNELAEKYKIICITGPTKSGKTVLCKRVLQEENCVWLAGGQIQSSDILWEQLVCKLNLPTEVSLSQSASVTGGLRSLISFQQSASEGRSSKISNSIVSTSLEFARQNNLSIIVDDFHYMPAEVQENFVRAVKSEVFNGLQVVLIAVPHHAFAAINVAREMEGRFAQIDTPVWSGAELRQIAELGFPKLNLDVHYLAIREFADEAFGSPLLMQRFCLRLCLAYEFYDHSKELVQLSPSDEKRQQIYSHVAKQFGLPAYKKLLAGPQSRKARLQRELKSGEKIDIYEAILLAIAKTGPNPEISYNEIRSILQNILIEDQVPQKNQITNAITHMVRIAINEIEGEPVIDWEEDRLYLMDPFLMFYLRWIARGKVESSENMHVTLTKLAKRSPMAVRSIFLGNASDEK